MHRATRLLVALALAAPAAARGEPRVVEREVAAPDAPAAALAVLGPGAPLSLSQVSRSLAGTHVRFQVRCADGTPVADEEAAVHFYGGGPGRWRARIVDAGRGRGAWTLVGARRIGEAEARARAQAAAGGTAAAAEAVARPAGPHLARPAWRVLVDVARPAALREVWVDADDGGVEVGRDLLVRATGSGYVYLPNPVTSSGDRGLLDNDDADSDELTALREVVTLEGLDGTGVLKGEYADAHNLSSRAVSPTLTFDYTRSQIEFEEVNAYYHIDRTQRQLQSLGFTGAKAILAQPFEVVVNMIAEDQSYYDPLRRYIRTGTGGVDDAEDADILIHEYGHAIQAAIVPGYGTSKDALALGEAFGDITAYAMPTMSSKAPGIERECIGPWDATAYEPPDQCLRRVDGPKHYPEHLTSDREPHYDGEIASAAWHDVFQEAGLGPVEGYRLVVQSLYTFSRGETFGAAAEALLVADESLYGGVHVPAIRRALTWRGLLATLAQPADFSGPRESFPATLDSEHPIPNVADRTHTFVQPGAEAVRAHFVNIDLETGAGCVDTFCDAIYIYDRAGNLYARMGGKASDVTSVAVPGDTLVVRWVTDPGGRSAGFTIDQLEAVMRPSVPDAGVPPSLPDAAPPMDRGEPGGGCGCRAAGRGGDGAQWLVALILGGAAARRRRRRARS